MYLELMSDYWMKDVSLFSKKKIKKIKKIKIMYGTGTVVWIITVDKT